MIELGPRAIIICNPTRMLILTSSRLVIKSSPSHIHLTHSTTVGYIDRRQPTTQQHKEMAYSIILLAHPIPSIIKAILNCPRKDKIRITVKISSIKLTSKNRVMETIRRCRHRQWHLPRHQRSRRQQIPLRCTTTAATSKSLLSSSSSSSLSKGIAACGRPHCHLQNRRNPRCLIKSITESLIVMPLHHHSNSKSKDIGNSPWCQHSLSKHKTPPASLTNTA